MKWQRLLFFVILILVLGMAAPAAAGTLNHSNQPGSVLVFPRYHTGTVTTLDQGTLPRTEFEISAVCPKDAGCSFKQPVGFKGHWICENSCDSGINFELGTTVNGTLFFYIKSPGDDAVNLPAGTTFVPPPDCGDNGERAYLIVYAIDGSGQQIKFDGLIGDAVLRGGTANDNCPNCVTRYDAIAIQAGWSIPTG